MEDDQQGSSKGPGMEWMYKGPAALVNREDYLLGRTVDKSLRLLEEAEKGNVFSYAEEVEKDLTPASIFASRGPSGPVDVIRKIKEDPLYQIQKKEEESLKQLLKNPVRMKQLQQLAEQRQESISSSKSKKHKKKHKRKSRHSSEDSDSDSKSTKHRPKANISKLLSEKLSSYKKILEQSSSDTSDSDKDNSSSKRRKHEVSKSPSRSHLHSHSFRDKYASQDHHRVPEKDTRDRKRSTRRSDSRDRPNYSRNRRETSRSTSYSHSYSSNSGKSSQPPPPPSNRKSYDESELEKKRQEMMENAKWREEQLKKNISKYREEDKKEEEKSIPKRGHDPDFIRKQLITAAETGSVEKRIKSNSFNIQRSKFSMDSNFVKR